MPVSSAHTADTLSGNVPGSAALLPKPQSPIEGAACKQKAQQQPLIDFQRNTTSENGNNFHSTSWLILKFVKRMQTRISSPLGVKMKSLLQFTVFA